MLVPYYWRGTEFAFRYRSIANNLLHTTATKLYGELANVRSTCDGVQLGERLDLFGLGIEKEVIILETLIKARDAITAYAFQDACIYLFSCKQELTEWKKLCEEQDFPEVCYISITYVVMIYLTLCFLL